MKPLAILLFLTPAFCSAQKLKFGSGAGINPRHIESIGPDSGWVEFWVGPMSMPGCVLRVDFSNPLEIDRILVWSQTDNGLYTHHLVPTISRNAAFLSVFGSVRQGSWLRFSYTVIYKKA